MACLCGVCSPGIAMDVIVTREDTRPTKATGEAADKAARRVGLAETSGELPAESPTGGNASSTSQTPSASSVLSIPDAITSGMNTAAPTAGHEKGQPGNQSTDKPTRDITEDKGEDVDDGDENDTASTEQDASVAPAVVTLQDRFDHVAMPPKPLKSVVSVGEKLTYQVKWKGLPVGEVTFHAKRTTTSGKQRVLYVCMEAESNDAINLVYPVKTKVKTYIDLQTGFPALYERDVREGLGSKTTVHDYLEFDFEQKIQNYVTIQGKKPAPKKTRPIPGPLQDPLSVLYYLRHFPLKVGDSREIIVGTRKKTSILEIEVLREEEIALPGLGTLNTLVIETKSNYDANLFVSKGKCTIWVEKNTNVPIMTKVSLPVGSAVAVLVAEEKSPLVSYLPLPKSK